jgi:uncharacterized protein (DUF3820 family)
MRRVDNMPFGRYKGRPIVQLPDGYVRWLAGLSDLREPLLSAVRDEIQRRGLDSETEARADVDGCPDARTAEALVRAGVKTLSLKHHPDRGGDHEDMVAINLAAEWLRRRLRALAS